MYSFSKSLHILQMRYWYRASGKCLKNWDCVSVSTITTTTVTWMRKNHFRCSGLDIDEHVRWLYTHRRNIGQRNGHSAKLNWQTPFYIDQCVLCDIHMCSFYSGLAVLPHTAKHYPWYDAEDRAEYAGDQAEDEEDAKWLHNFIPNGFFIQFCYMGHSLIDVWVSHPCLELGLWLYLWMEHRHIRGLTNPFFLSCGYVNFTIYCSYVEGRYM